MDLLYSVIILLLIALVWTGIIFLSFKRMIDHQTRRDKRMLLGGLLLFIAMIVIVVAGTVAFEYVESPQFCGTFCHVMEPYYDSYLRPGNNSMMAIHAVTEMSCSNCHDEPGIVGKIQGLLAAIPEAYLYYTNSYDPENLGGEFSRESCLKCHDGSVANVSGYVTTASGKIVNPHADKKKCTDCHETHHVGFGLSENSCSVCHGISLENFEEMLSDHAERAGTDCMTCHNRDHPDDALISFKEYPALINTDFCSDCHGGNVERLRSGEHESESCMGCHNEHGALTINFDNCYDSCHEPATGHDSKLASCTVCHDTSTIHLKPGVDLGESFSDITCFNCHAAENSAYESSFTPKSLEIYGDNGCIDCHSEHKAIIYPHLKTSPFDDCGSCHSTYNTASTVHDRTGISYLGFPGIINDFCSDCHDSEAKRFGRELHNAMQCTDCHSEHGILRVKFNNCISCHDPPSDHDTSLTSCSGSTCHDDMRAIHSET
ncbi:MAG: NapC/NirT family cytochrome c [Thermoplasmatales archaeon]|nr:MAG: NapC/NirT family cytochrome c [Thermoplasmatales archaeon]